MGDVSSRRVLVPERPVYPTVGDLGHKYL